MLLPDLAWDSSSLDSRSPPPATTTTFDGLVQWNMGTFINLWIFMENYGYLSPTGSVHIEEFMDIHGASLQILRKFKEENRGWPGYRIVKGRLPF